MCRSLNVYSTENRHEYQPLTAPILPARATQHPLPVILRDCAQGSGRLPNGSLVTYNPRHDFKTCVKRTWQIGVCCNQTGQHSTHCHPFYATGPKILASDSGWLGTHHAPRRRSNIYYVVEPAKLSLR